METYSHPAAEPLEASRFLDEGVAGAFQKIKGRLEQLKHLQEDWDEGGGKPYDPKQVARVEAWWREFLLKYQVEYAALPPLPTIGAAEDQTIDIHWDGDFSLLLNVPESPKEYSSYHGFRVKDEKLEFQGMAPLESLGKTMRALVRDFCG